MKRQLLRLARRIYRRDRRPDDWRGVYGSPGEVREDGAGFASDIWIEMTRALTVRAIEAGRAASLSSDLKSDTQLLAAVVALAPHSDESIRILDFGGGMGIAYVQLMQSLGAARRVDYHIVEGERVCREGSRLLAEHPRVTFRSTMPERGATFDIVVACSSLQYIVDHRELLTTFAAYRPRHILIGDLPAGDVSTFWTAQLTVPGSRIAYKFYNYRELVDAMAALGYPLVVRGVAERPLNVACLPPGRRVPRTLNLLFGQ